MFRKACARIKYEMSTGRKRKFVEYLELRNNSFGDASVAQSFNVRRTLFRCGISYQTAQLRVWIWIWWGFWQTDKVIIRYLQLNVQTILCQQIRSRVKAINIVQSLLDVLLMTYHITIVICSCISGFKKRDDHGRYLRCVLF